MNVEELLDLMEETLEAGTAVPFAAAKRVVDVDRMRDIIDEVRNNLPDEVRESKKIVNDREQILKNARMESETIIQQAEERARGLVSEQEIVKRSQQRAVEILTAAQGQAKELTRNATMYCESILKNSEEVLARSVSDIKSTRMNLRSAANRPPSQQKVNAARAFAAISNRACGPSEGNLRRPALRFSAVFPAAVGRCVRPTFHKCENSAHSELFAAVDLLFTGQNGRLIIL